MENNHKQLVDQYNRRLNYLRISVTDRCNLRCLYCLPCEGIPKLRHEDILTYEEILRIAGIAVKLGVEKIRLTGGEPLVRKDLCKIIPHLTGLTGLKDVALTTNGIYLKENLEKLKTGGIKRLNISLDSFKRERYQKITGFDGLEQVLAGIDLADQMGFQPIKINVVVIKGVNDDEVLDFARFSLEHPYHIRFIEYMPLGIASAGNSLHHVPSSVIKEKLGSLGKLALVSKTELDGPAERFSFEGAPGEIGFISPLTHHFCHTCNRLRLTASGRLRPCLLSDQEEDLKGPMRKGASDNDLANIFLKTAFNKPLEHTRASHDSLHFPGQMSSIGG
jgi:cyclic pyranopterin phosphate synthase